MKLRIYFLPLDIIHYTTISLYSFMIKSIIQINKYIKGFKSTQYLFIEDFNSNMFDTIQSDFKKKNFNFFSLVSCLWILVITFVVCARNIDNFIISVPCVFFILSMVTYVSTYKTKKRIFIPFYYLHFIVKIPILIFSPIISYLLKTTIKAIMKVNKVIPRNLGKSIEYSTKKNSILLNALEKKERKFKDEA